MPARDHLLQIQRSLYDRFRSSARQSVGDLSPPLRKYFQEYQRELVDYKALSSHAELVGAFLRADIFVCGDYHTLPEAQRTVLRLLTDSIARLRAKRRRPVLALEMLRPSHNPTVRQYLSGRLNERDFLNEIGFDRNWGFDWANYRPLFELARKEGIRLVGLNASPKGRKPTLQQRDRFAARVLAGIVRTDPRATVLALVGDLHLAQNHLPSALKKEFGKRDPRKVVVLHQNPERIYWKLASRGLEQQGRVLKLKRDVYCVMNTPPWVKLQSYLRWLDWTDGAHETTDEFLDFLKTLQKCLGIDRPVDDGFEIVWGPGDSGKTGRIRPFQRRFRRKILEAVGSYFVPEETRVLLTNASVNSAATQAAIYLHARLSGRKRSFEFPRQDFYPAIWVEALGFLGSKFINPQRRCFGPRDFKALIEKEPLARAVAAHWDAEKQAAFQGRFAGVSLPARATTPERAVFFYRVARCLGRILGAALYAGLGANRVKPAEIRALFENPFSDGKKALALYLEWTRRLDQTALRENVRY